MDQTQIQLCKCPTTLYIHTQTTILNTVYLKMLSIVIIQIAESKMDNNIMEESPSLESKSDQMKTLHTPKGIHSQSKHKYRNASGDVNIQCYDFDNSDAFTFKDKYIAPLQQEFQNPYWCLHDPIMTKSYQTSTDMDIETMPHVMYFSGNIETVTKINHVPYQTISNDDKGMFQANLMDNTPVQIFIDNGATPSILPLSTYNKHPLLQTYPKTESNTPIHTGGITFLD